MFEPFLAFLLQVNTLEPRSSGFALRYCYLSIHSYSSLLLFSLAPSFVDTPVLFSVSSYNQILSFTLSSYAYKTFIVLSISIIFSLASSLVYQSVSRSVSKIHPLIVYSANEIWPRRVILQAERFNPLKFPLFIFSIVYQFMSLAIFYLSYWNS